jgi:hypothetical protein
MKVKYSINANVIFILLVILYISFKRNKTNKYFNLLWSDNLVLFDIDVNDFWTYACVSLICMGAGIFGVLRSSVIDPWLYLVTYDPLVKKVDNFSRAEIYYYVGIDETCEMISRIIGIGSSIVQVDFFIYTLLSVLITLFFVVKSYIKDKTFETYPDYYSSRFRHLMSYFRWTKTHETIETANEKNDNVNFDLSELTIK